MLRFCLSFLLGSVCSLGSYAQDAPAAPTLKIGDMAPPVDVKWIKGNSSTAIKEKRPYVIELWATWCIPCINGMPHLSEVARKYRGKADIIGVSVLERGQNIEPRVQRFADSMGRNMDYTVALDNDGFVAKNWLTAAGMRGIPQAFAVDGQGRIAWMGVPKDVDTVLARLVNNTWSIEKESQAAAERKRLSKIDGLDVVKLLNPYMKPDRYALALVVIDSIVSKEPGLKYYPKLGHYTFYALLNTSPLEAAKYGKKWFAANEWPGYTSVVDAMGWARDNKKTYPREVNEFALTAFQKQMKHYPPNATNPTYLWDMAWLYHATGKKKEAVFYMQKAITLAEGNETLKSNVPSMKKELEKYQKN